MVHIRSCQVTTSVQPVSAYPSQLQTPKLALAKVSTNLVRIYTTDIQVQNSATPKKRTRFGISPGQDFMAQVSKWQRITKTLNLAGQNFSLEPKGKFFSSPVASVPISTGSSMHDQTKEPVTSNISPPSCKESASSSKATGSSPKIIIPSQTGLGVDQILNLVPKILGKS